MEDSLTYKGVPVIQMQGMVFHKHGETYLIRVTSLVVEHFGGIDKLRQIYPGTLIKIDESVPYVIERPHG